MARPFIPLAQQLSLGDTKNNSNNKSFSLQEMLQLSKTPSDIALGSDVPCEVLSEEAPYWVAAALKTVAARNDDIASNSSDELSATTPPTDKPLESAPLTFMNFMKSRKPQKLTKKDASVKV